MNFLPEISASEGHIAFRTGTTALHKEELHTVFTEVVPAHVHHQLHVGVPVLGGLAARTYLVHCVCNSNNRDIWIVPVKD